MQHSAISLNQSTHHHRLLGRNARLCCARIGAFSRRLTVLFALGCGALFSVSAMGQTLGPNEDIIIPTTGTGYNYSIARGEKSLSFAKEAGDKINSKKYSYVNTNRLYAEGIVKLLCSLIVEGHPCKREANSKEIEECSVKNEEIQDAFAERIKIAFDQLNSTFLNYKESTKDEAGEAEWGKYMNEIGKTYSEKSEQQARDNEIKNNPVLLFELISAQALKELYDPHVAVGLARGLDPFCAPTLARNISEVKESTTRK